MIEKKRILYEDNHLIIVNKLSGEIVQGDQTGDRPLVEDVKEYIKKNYNKPGDVFLGIPHRLDRPTSGAVIFARTSKALVRINNMLRDKEIDKRYWAIVDSLPEQNSAELVHYLVRNRDKNRVFAHDTPKKESQKAHLTYHLIGATKNYYLLEIELHTGRHHQIRAQLAKIGCHIKGDLKYGAKRSNDFPGIHLHARKLTFIHPVKNTPIEITAPLPPDNLWQEFKNV